MKNGPTIIVAAVLGTFVARASAQNHYTAHPIPPSSVPPAGSGDAGLSMDWNTIDAGARALSGGSLTMSSTLGQADAGDAAAGLHALSGGFWPGVEGDPPCYANCDGSMSVPVLTANDLTCFINRFSAGETYANCDGSTTPPALNILDFQCFLMKFSAGCS